MPAMWFEQKFTMDAEMASQLKFVTKMPCIGRFIGMVMVALGLFFVVVSFLITCVKKKSSSKRQKMEINLGDDKVAVRLKKEVSPLINQEQVKPIIVPRKETAS